MTDCPVGADEVELLMWSDEPVGGGVSYTVRARHLRTGLHADGSGATLQRAGEAALDGLANALRRKPE